jgi:predicted nucleotidyltransferase
MNGAIMDKEYIKKTIVAALSPLEPEKVILFGSYASGTAKQDSDADVYVVSREERIPANYAENMRHYKKYSRPLKDLKREIAIDLIVHTKAMNRIFENERSSFARDILENGERLI